MPLIGRKIPQIVTKAVLMGKDIDENFNLSDLEGKYTVLFFYPLDFTFVCPTELHAFQEKLEVFENMNCQVVGCSVDSHFSHLAWLQTPKKKGGIEGITYPLLADMNKEIARAFGVLKEDEGIAYRGLFLIDKEGIIRHMLINDLPLGRSVDEALRLLAALQFFEKNGEVCPANWHEGNPGMSTDQKGLETFFENK